VRRLGQAAAHRQSRGQWGARDFDKVLLDLPIPDFSSAATLHGQIVTAANHAQEVAATVGLRPDLHFIRARASIRAALMRDGVGSAIDAVVAELLGLPLTRD
jgi:hypothetical protein